MKRLICAIAIIAVSFTVSVLGSRYVNTSLDEIIFTAENEPEKLEGLWQKKRGMLSILLHNGDIDSIEEQIYADSDVKELTAVVKSVKDSEQFNIGNIL